MAKKIKRTFTDWENQPLCTEGQVPWPSRGNQV